jgi:hypothetical protein
MWLFTKSGHLSMAQHPTDPGRLVIHAQSQEDVERFVTLLDGVGKERHEAEPSVESGYRFTITARRSVVAQAVARIVGEIDYQRFTQSVHFDFGHKPEFLLWTSPTGVQVARVKPE